ncbi:MAG: membrane dipeptidase, partial [Phycisphaerales bacterium]|nr:membrane dipeptidase [Phycisphaerales bacterium]
ASHSNCRSLMGPLSRETQRHLSDDTIREIAARGGIIGINLVTNFLDPHAQPGTRASIEHVVAHIEHACTIAGDTAHVALGSDADGGFSALGLPAGIHRPADFQRLAEALRDRGWSDGDVEGFASGNWIRFWSGA